MSEVKRVFNYKKIIMLGILMFLRVQMDKVSGRLTDTINTLSHIMMRLIQ